MLKELIWGGRYVSLHLCTVDYDGKEVETLELKSYDCSAQPDGDNISKSEARALAAVLLEFAR